MKEPDSLLLLLMSYYPDNLDEEVAAHDYVVVNKRKMKMIVPKKTGSEIDGLETILEEEEGEQ
jgi:hypothetical protein